MWRNFRYNPVRKFYHTGKAGLKKGTILQSDGYYSASPAREFLEKIFESVRKEHYPERPSRLGAVYLSAEPGEYAPLRGGTIYEVKTRGPVSKHDMEWVTYSIIDLKEALLFGGRLDTPSNLRSVEEAAHGYWSGESVNEEDDDPEFYVKIYWEYIPHGDAWIHRKVRAIRRNPVCCPCKYCN